MTKTILLVDDEPNILWSLSRSLRREPYQIYTARSAEECVHLLKARPIDLVITDEWMQDMRGTDLLLWMANEFRDVPRILITGKISREVRDRALTECGAYAVLGKPCDTNKLAKIVRQALSESATLNSFT